MTGRDPLAAAVLEYKNRPGEWLTLENQARNYRDLTTPKGDPT